MGLTIHNSLSTLLTRPGDVRELLEPIRQVARDLPFKKVGEFIEFKGQDADHETSGQEDEHRWFKIQAGAYVEAGDRHYSVKPVHIIGFSTWPGEGCESANFGFCKYPGFLETSASGRKQRLATKLGGWRWGSFCKTQYASDPQYGGVENFLRCHLCVIKLLDFIQKTGLVTVTVCDEGDYWMKRDLAALAREVGEWNEFLAAFAGVLKNQASANGVVLEAAIAGFGNFEQLAAKGLDRLAMLRAGQRKQNL